MTSRHGIISSKIYAETTTYAVICITDVARGYGYQVIYKDWDTHSLFF